MPQNRGLRRDGPVRGRAIRRGRQHRLQPTFDDHLFTVEVYILDFDRNIYDQKIRVNFIKRIRDELKFSGIAALAEQIKKDVIEARRILTEAVHAQREKTGERIKAKG